MKALSSVLRESLMDDEDTILKDASKNIKEQIKQFLKANYRGASSCKISRKPDTDGKFIVDCNKGLKVINTALTSLTNEYFKFGVVSGSFDCQSCKSLTSLEGAPREVGEFFNCNHCHSLVSLEGAPREVGEFFNCSHCHSLVSLEGAPREVSEFFDCNFCRSLVSLEGAPKEVDGFNCEACNSLTSLKGAPEKVSFFSCRHCKSLTSLEGAPKEVDGFSCGNCKSLTSLKGAPEKVAQYFDCYDCKGAFTEDDVKRVSKVGGIIRWKE